MRFSYGITLLSINVNCFLSWDISAAHVDLEKELQALAAQAPEGEEARNGERLIQYATENLVTEVLIHPQVNTLLQCVRNLLSSFTRHRHLVHAGYTFAGSGSWCLQDGTFSLADFIDAFQESEVQRVLRAYENCVTVDIHCSPEGDWTSERLSKETFSRLCKVRVNPDDCLTAGSAPIANFINYLSPFLRPASIEQLLEPSDVVGNIRFSHPTLYVFPGGQGDAALFGINGFNMLVDGGFARKACFWDFARHLDRLDAVLITRLNNGNVNGISAVLRRKKQGHVYPQIGHFFCNVQERRHCASPDGDKDRDPLLINLADEGHEMVLNLRQLQLRPHACYREGNQVEPVNLYHKVGHGKLDMYIISPARDSREVKEFLAKWNSNDPKLFSNIGKKDSSKEFHFPLQNLISICALLVWQPANPNDTITRILFPGSTPQHKIFEGLEKLRHLEFLKFPVCSARSLSPSSSTVGISSRASSKQRTAPAVIDKLLPGEGVKTSRPTSEVNKHASKAATIPVAGSMPEPKPTKASTPVSSAPAPPISKAPQAKPKAEKTPKSEIKPKTDAIKSTETEKASAKSEKTTKVSVDATKTKVEHKSKVESKTTKSRTDSKPPRSTERKIQKAGSTEKKTDMKSSPTTPKKSVEAKVNGVASKSEPAKSTRPSSKTRPSPSATPAKSTKEANNRKVVESKYHVSRVSTTRASASKTTKKETPEAPKTERKPISRRPKTGSPTKAPSGSRPPGSPAKSSSAKSTPTPSVKSEKDGVIRKTKAETERLTTDSSAVSTPSTVDPETALLKAKGVEPEDKHPPLMNGDLTKEEKTVVQEIEDAIAAEEAKAVEQEVEEESEEQVQEVVQTTEAVVEATEVKEGESAVEEEITKEEEDDEEEDEVEEEERIKEEVVENVQSIEAQEETEREADEEEEEGEVEEKESEVIEDEVQLEKQTLEKEEVEATEEEQTEDMEDMEEDEAPIDIRESLQAELELEAKRGEVAEERDAEEEEEEEYLVIEKEEVEQAEESMQEPESLESHVPEDGGVREVETEEDEGELQKHLRDEADSEKLKRIQEGEVKVNGFHHEPEEQVHEEEIVKELDVTIAQIKDEAEIKKEDIGKAIEKELASSVQQKEAVKEEVPPAGIADTLEKGKEETVLKKDEEPTALEESKPEGIPQEAKEQIQEEVQEIISSAKEIVSKTKLESEKKPEVEEVARIKDQSKDESAEDKKETEEVSSTSPEEKLDVSSEKNKEMTEDTRDTDQKFEEQDEAVEVKETGSKEILDQKYPAEESQPDEKFSTTVESAATTAPTLPEDERIPLDEIKEIVEEKYVKEETKEKEKPVEVVPRFEQPTTLPQVVIPTGIGLFDQHPHHPIIHRDIVKTPDEVADLPVHEEVDPGTYDSEEYPREISKQKPEVEDIKSPEVDVKEELPLKYEEVSKPTHEEKESKEIEKEGKEIEKEGKEIETVIPEPVVTSQPDDKDITEKVAPQMTIPDDLIKTDKKFETEVDSQKVTDITDEVAKADIQVDEKEEKELPLKPEQELKEEFLETETKADEAVSTQAPKDSQKPQEISVTTDLESKEKDIKKDDPKTERKTEAVETPQSEISDIESKDKDTEKGMFKEQEKEVKLTEVKDITSQFISHERVSASGEIDELRQEDIPKPLETERDEQKESETVEDEKKDVTTVSMPDDIPQKEEKISTEIASEEADKDIKKPDEKEILDTDSKLTKDISSDLETKEVKLEESELPEVVKSTETVKEPGILGDSSALSATYLEIIEKLQQDAPDSDTDISAALKDQEPTTESEKDAKTQEQVKDTDAKIVAILPEIEDIKDDSKETKTTEVKKDEAEKFEAKEIKDAKIETDIIVSTSDVADEILKDTIDIKREVIDLQEHTEKVKDVAPSYEKEILKEGEDTDDLKKSTPYLEDDIKSLTQEKEASVDTKESSTPLDVTQADEKKLKDTTEITKSVDEVALETAETMSTAVKESEKEVIEKQIKEIEPKIETTTQDIISEKEIKSQEKGDKISIESEERPKEEISKQVTSTKEDKVLEEPVVEAEAKIIAEKDITTDKKEESPEHKVQEISTDKILTEDEHKTEQKEIIETTAIISEAEKDTIEMKDEVIEAEKIMDFGKETIQLEEVTEKEKSKDQIEETDLVEVTDAQELTKSQEPSFKVETEDLVKIEEKQSAKDEEKEDIQISEKSSTLAEKEDKKEDKENILPSSTLDSIEDQASLETILKTPETETTPQRVSTEVLQPDDTDVKLVKDSTFIEPVALPSQKDQDISKVDKALKDELTLEQDDSEISKIEKSVSEMQLIEDSFKMEISKKKQEFSEPIKFDIPEAAKEADVSLMSQAHTDEKLQKEEVTVKDIDMHEKEVKGDISETDMAEKDTEKTEIIESKADQKIFIPQETDKVMLPETTIIEKDIQEEDKTESAQKPKENLSSISEIKEKITEVSPKQDICESKESETPAALEQKIEEDTSKVVAVEDKHSDSIPLETEAESVMSKIPKQEVTEIHDTEIQKQEECIIKESKDVEELISKDGDISRKIDDIKGEPQQSIIHKDEIKPDLEEQVDHKDVDKSKQKSAISEAVKIDSVEQESMPRKESLKTEEKVEKDTEITEKDKPIKESDTQQKPSDSEVDAASLVSICDEKAILETQDAKKQQPGLDASEKEDVGQKSFYDQLEDGTGDGEPPPSPGDEFIDSGLEEEPVFTKLEAPEHPEYVTVTPDSTPASPKALPSFVKAREEEQHQIQETPETDSKIESSKKDVLDDIPKEQIELKDDTKKDEKLEESSQKSQIITEPSGTDDHHIEKPVTETSSKFEDIVSSTTESSATKIVSPPKSPLGVSFKEEPFEESKSTNDHDEIKTTKTYDETAIAEAKVLDDSVQAEETVTFTTSVSKTVDDFLAMERKVEDTLRSTVEKSSSEISTSIIKVTTQETDLSLSESVKEQKDTKVDADESASVGETIVSSISDTKISEKAEIESSEKEIIKSSKEESSEVYTVSETKMIADDSSKLSSEITSSEIVSVTKSETKPSEYAPVEETTTEVSTVTSETKEVKEVETLKEDSTLSTTVKKMLVTASSEDGGAETVLCATGTIKSIDSKKPETEDIPITSEKTAVEKEKFSQVETLLSKEAEEMTKHSVETVQYDSHSDDSSEKSQMKIEKPTHPIVTDVKQTNGHLHESDVDIQSTDEEEIIDGKRIFKTKTIKTTTTTKVVRKSVSESTDSEDEHKDSVTETTEVGDDGKIITRKITRTYHTIVKQGEESDVVKSPSKSIEVKDSESSKLTQEHAEKEGSTTYSEQLVGPETSLASSSATTTTTTVTKVVTGDSDELVSSTTKKVIETDTLKSTTITTTDEHGDVEVKSFKEVTDTKLSSADDTDFSKITTETLLKEARSLATTESETVPTTQTKDSVETLTKHEITETTTSRATFDSTKDTVSSVSKDSSEIEKDTKIRDEPACAVSGPLAVIKKESSDTTRSATPGSDAMSDRDFDVGGPSTPHSDISSGQASRVATNIWGSEGRPGSQHYDSDEEEEGPVSPLSVTSQVAPSPPPPHFDFEMLEHQKSHEIEEKHSTVHVTKEEHTKQSSEIYKGPQQALSSSMTSSFYGSLPAEPPLSPEGITMKGVDPMSASFIMQSEDPEHKSIFSTSSTYTYGEYDVRDSATFEHFSSTSQGVSDDTVDFQQALYEHRAARGEDLTTASTSTTYHYKTKVKDTHASPEKTVTYEHTSSSGVNGQRKDHSFKEFTEDYGNGNLAGAKQFEDLMNRNREPGHLESKLNGKSADEYSDFSGPTSTESYSQDVYSKVSTVDPSLLRNGSDEKKTITTTTVTTVTKTSTAEPEVHITTQPLTGPSTAAQAFPEPPQGFGLPSVSKTETKKDPIEGWGKPLGLPAPAPPPTNNTNAQGEVMAMTNTNKGTPKKEKKVMQMKKSMIISENNKTTGQMGKDKTKSPESPVKQKAGSNKVGIGNAKSSLAPIYVDLSYVPHHGNSYYTALDFFKKVRARYYVFSGTEPSREVYNALLEAKQTWEDKELEVTIIPTYDTDTLGYWVAENEDALAKCKIDLSPSASRCTINLQDHETSCSAYRLEF